MPEKRIKISLPEDKQIHIDRDIKRFLPSTRYLRVEGTFVFAV